MAAGSSMPSCSRTERRSWRRHVWGSADSSAASRWAAAMAVPVGTTRFTSPIASASVGVDGATGQDQVHRPALADESRQADGSAVDERHAVPAAEHAEHGILRRDPQVAPQRDLQSAGDGVPLDGGDDGLGQAQSRRTHRTVAVGSDPVGLGRSLGVQVGAGAERATRAAEHGHTQRGVRVEGPQRIGEQRRGRPVNSVAPLRTVDEYREDGAVDAT